MRHNWTLLIDLTWVALSAIIAVLIRDNFVPYAPHLQAVIAYAGIAVAACAVVFMAMGLHKTLWQYTSLSDVLRLLAAVTVGLLLALSISFVASRLEGVSRSVPVIQWFLLIAAMIGTRAAVRLWHERSRRGRMTSADNSVQHVLVIGLSHLTEFYLRAVAEHGEKAIEIVGILSEKRELHGRSLRFHKILGTPEELTQVIAQLEVHGVALERIVVTQPFDQLSRRAGEALLQVERASGIKVDWMTELLGFDQPRDSRPSGPQIPKFSPAQTTRAAATETSRPVLGTFGYVKRVMDILGASVLIVLLSPLIVLVSLLVALDVGLPLVFWQKRPGRHGYPFKLYKFRTMQAAHDEHGHRIPDEHRSSPVGRFFRRTKLDELPQLFNVFMGEMSFVGPRPLIEIDQPIEKSARLLVRPGLTGLAQVRGGRSITAEDKNALDIWYIHNASLWLDIQILLRTAIVVIGGERVDHYALRVAKVGLERLKLETSQGSESCSRLSDTDTGSDGQVKVVHPVSG
jgi:lipopolysaccharide/colanic/teichoic acid biosynthesis glycosyltransferase